MFCDYFGFCLIRLEFEPWPCSNSYWLSAGLKPVLLDHVWCSCFTLLSYKSLDSPSRFVSNVGSDLYKQTSRALKPSEILVHDIIHVQITKF